MTRIITVDDLAVMVSRMGIDALVDELIGALAGALRTHDPDRLTTHDRTGFDYHTPHLGLVEWMPAMDRGRRVAIKTVGYHPDNPRRLGLPSVLATTSLYDPADGRLVAICEATTLTALRTGAASAVATDILGRPGPVTLGVIGCGAQAVSQIHAISRVRPLQRIIAHDADPAVAESLARRLAGVVDGVAVETVGNRDLGGLMADSDVICTCTTVAPGEGPVLPHGEHRPWLHVNAVGADFPGKCELPLALLREALVVPDVPAQCLAEGEAQQLSATDLGPDLSALARNAGEYRGYRNRLTVFDSTGWSFEDLVVADLVLARCEALGLGTVTPLQPTTTDPYDPYDRLRPAWQRGDRNPAATGPRPDPDTDPLTTGAHL